MASKQLIYTHRNPPTQYDPSWTASEFGNIERALKKVATQQVLTIVHGTNPNPTIPDTLDGFITVDATSGGHTVSLPTPSTCTGVTYVVKKIDTSANAVTVHATIDGTLNYSLAAQNNSVTVYSDGSNYWKIAST